MKSVGLEPETAGELQFVVSENELSVITTMENLIKVKAGYEGLPLSSETLKGLEIECGMLCYEHGIDQEGIFKLAYENVESLYKGGL